jgi:GDP-L-fucose synthase
MTVAVVGATGLVGRHVVEALCRAGVPGIAATWNSRRPFDAPGVRWVRGDLSRPEGAGQALKTSDEAVVCAGQLSTSAVLRRDPIESVLQTLRVVTNVLEAAARQRLRRIVLVSSCTGYPDAVSPAVEADMLRGDPPSQWFGVGWMHRYLEKQLDWYVNHLGLIGSGIVLRPSLVYGPHDDFSRESGHFVPAFVRQVVERVRPISVWGDGQQTRNLLHAADLAEAILVALQREKQGVETFNIASLDEVSVNAVLRYLAEIDGFSDVEIVHDLIKGGGPAALCPSGASFTAATDWTARRDIRTGLAETVAWFRATLTRNDALP